MAFKNNTLNVLRAVLFYTDVFSGSGIGDNENERDVLKSINNRLATYIDKGLLSHDI